jgi:hypothetical protein
MERISRLTPAARHCYDDGMSNRILRVQVRDRSLDPAQAELWVAVEAEHVTATTELRGRLMGPRCLYAATVEVAYPVRPYLRPLTGRVVIPEPCLWEPQSPFLYQGNVELWEDDRQCDQVEVRRGLRRILLGPSGLRVNSQPLVLRGRTAVGCDEAEAAVLRRDGCNLLMLRGEAGPALWDMADRYGFFVLARMHEWNERSLAQARSQAEHPSCFGWLLELPFDRWTAEAVKLLRCTRASVGVELAEPSAAPLPEGIAFVACPAAASGWAPGLPLLLVGAGPDASGMIGRVQ